MKYYFPGGFMQWIPHQRKLVPYYKAYHLSKWLWDHALSGNGWQFGFYIPPTSAEGIYFSTIVGVALFIQVANISDNFQVLPAYFFGRAIIYFKNNSSSVRFTACMASNSFIPL
jgi:hypothetical protein